MRQSKSSEQDAMPVTERSKTVRKHRCRPKPRPISDMVVYECKCGQQFTKEYYDAYHAKK